MHLYMNTADLPRVNRILKSRYNRTRAPIVEFVSATTGDPFKILVSTILSSRTKDRTTADAVKRLFSRVETPADLRKLSTSTIEKLIFPVGFFRVKAKHLKKLGKELQGRFDDTVPDTMRQLCDLPGVGRKTANLVLTVAFDKHAICVDIHVHRISNRFGLVKTSTPLETEMALRSVLPLKYWKTWNSYLVSLGQTVCLPRKPLCSDCPLYDYCNRAGI